VGKGLSRASKSSRRDSTESKRKKKRERERSQLFEILQSNREGERGRGKRRGRSGVEALADGVQEADSYVESTIRSSTTNTWR